MMQLKGSMVALVTPFKNGEVDMPALDRLVDFQLSEGTDGLVLCGTTAESPTLSDDEQREIVKSVVQKVSGRCPVVVGTGTNSTVRTLALSQQAQALGADALMLVTPYYNKPTQRGLYKHFGHIASKIDLPIILYNIPGRTALAIAQDTICKLFDDFENIVTVKHATGSVDEAASLHAACRIDILSGDDPITLPLMAVGAIGVISVVANILPADVKTLTDAFLSGRQELAREAHDKLYPLSKALLSLETNPNPIKTAMALRGMIEEEFRLPLCKMEPAGKEALGHILTSAGLL